MQADRPDFVGAYGWLEEDGRVLLVATERDLGAAGRQTCWELPGGKLEPRETERDALTREMREETQLDVRIGRRVFELHGERFAGGRRRYGWRGSFYEIERLAGQEPAAGDGVVAVRFAAISELREWLTAPFHRPILEWVEGGRRMRSARLRWEDDPAPPSRE
ncbi:MAG TPA: NUDIX hydrolase [Planctomycetota bacterium]|nr:NUDIX hydrolase [Planctomycetota bacterium]